MDGSLPDKLVKQWIDNSYNLVAARLPAKVRPGLTNFKLIFTKLQVG